MQIDLYTAVFCVAVLFIAYIVRGITGFGSGLIAVPLMALIFPLQMVVPIVVLLDYVGSASQGFRNRQVVAWREQLPLIPFTLVGVAIGLSLLQSLASATLAQALGVFIRLLQRAQLQRPHVLAAHADLALVDVIEAVEQLEERGLAAAARANNPERRPRGHAERNVA